MWKAHHFGNEDTLVSLASRATLERVGDAFDVHRVMQRQHALQVLGVERVDKSVRHRGRIGPVGLGRPTATGRENKRAEERACLRRQSFHAFSHSGLP